MKKKILLPILLTLICSTVWCSNRIKNISDDAKFYLVTCEPGDAVYARFGHSGIRVYDPKNNIDEVFHWGLFSFDTPNFIGRFISGNTDYEMGVFRTKYFMREYIERGSSVYAQELNLTTEEKDKLWAKLWLNYRPENRKYRYNFIYDNCATRPYQLIISTYEYNVSLNYDLNNITYRDIINRYVPIGSILNTGINLIIGKQADKYLSPKESVAFPMYAMDALNHTEQIKNNSRVSIVKNQEVMHKAERKDYSVSKFMSFISIIIPLILAFICGLYTFKKKRYLPYFTQLILFVSGLVGIVICYLWFFSHHPLVNNNINILWCNPLNILLSILLFIHHKSLRLTKLVISTLLLLLSHIFLLFLIINVQSTTSQIFSIWILMLTVDLTIVHTYKYKFKKLLPRKYKK